MIELSGLDVEDFLTGAVILGTGGGGDRRDGKALLSKSRTLRLRISNASELPADRIAICPYLVGSIAGPSQPASKLVGMLKEAVSIIEQRTGRRVGATVPTEIGGLNSAIALYVAGLLGVPMIDGDVVGRAAPEVNHSLVLLKGHSLAPGVAQTASGLTVIIEKYKKVEEYESLLRQLSIVSQSYLVVVDSLFSIGEMRGMIIKGTMSKSLNLGRVRRKAVHERRDVADAIASAIDGHIIFRGTIKDAKIENKGGFLRGMIKVRSDNKARPAFKSFIMNEHIFGWIGSSPAVMPPDSFTFLDENGHGLANTDVSRGARVSVVAWKAAPVWRTRKGLEQFGPRHFGLQYDYIPLERLIRKHRSADR